MKLLFESNIKFVPGDPQREGTEALLTSYHGKRVSTGVYKTLASLANDEI